MLLIYFILFELLSLWEDALAAAGDGAGPQLVDGAGRG